MRARVGADRRLGGFGVDKIRAFESEGVPVDATGSVRAGAHGEFDFTADVVLSAGGKPSPRLGRTGQATKSPFGESCIRRVPSTRVPREACVFWDVDTQVDFIHPDGKLYVAGAETIVSNLAPLTDFAHLAGPHQGSSDSHASTDDELSETRTSSHVPAALPRRNAGPETDPRDHVARRARRRAGRRDCRSLERLPGHHGDILFHKRYFDVFTNPNVGPVIDALAIDQVVLYGVALDVCNRYAVEGLLARYPRLPITLVTDAVRAINEDARGELLTDWQQRGVKLAGTAEVVANVSPRHSGPSL